jgi:hypothetical protein
MRSDTGMQIRSTDLSQHGDERGGGKPLYWPVRGPSSGCMDVVSMETERSQARRFRAAATFTLTAIIARPEGGRDGRRYHQARRSLGPDSERLW